MNSSPLLALSLKKEEVTAPIVGRLEVVPRGWSNVAILKVPVGVHEVAQGDPLPVLI